MIGVIPSPTSPLFSAGPLRPLTPPAAAGHAGGTAWLDGLGAGGPGSLRADVAADQRGLSVQQHAERVLAALLA